MEKTRKHIYELNQGICERCGAVLPSSHMNVHHKTYKNIGNEKEEELCLLCENCHAIVHGKIQDGNGNKAKCSEYFIKNRNESNHKHKVGKRECKKCVHATMYNKRGKVKYKCNEKNIALTYSEKRICGKYENIGHNDINSLQSRVRTAVMYEIKDEKTIDQINKKYGLSKKEIKKIIDP